MGTQKRNSSLSIKQFIYQQMMLVKSEFEFDKKYYLNLDSEDNHRVEMAFQIGVNSVKVIDTEEVNGTQQKTIVISWDSELKAMHILKEKSDDTDDYCLGKLKSTFDNLYDVQTNSSDEDILNFISKNEDAFRSYAIVAANNLTRHTIAFTPFSGAQVPISIETR